MESSHTDVLFGTPDLWIEPRIRVGILVGENAVFIFSPIVVVIINELYATFIRGLFSLSFLLVFRVREMFSLL